MEANPDEILASLQPPHNFFLARFNVNSSFVKAKEGWSNQESKRTPVRLRHKIEKASAAKQRKARKASKANPEWRSRLKKDPGIPNLFPYKDRILHDIEEKKRLKEEDFIRKRDEARAARKAAATTSTNAAADLDPNQEDGLVDDEDMEDDTSEDSNPMAALLASAKAQVAEYEDQSDGSTSDEMDDDAPAVSIPTVKDPSRRAFNKTFDTVLSTSDVLLYVLDARDPTGTRSIPTERHIASIAGGSKRLILILNKIDLVPAPVLQAWLVHLRRSFPTLALRASPPAPNARIFDHKSLTRKATADTLLRALKSYAAAQNLKRAISVGVVGFPNVGKSSVINALLGQRDGNRGRTGASASSSACPVGAEAGVTTVMREVKLDNKLTLLDCPGIVFPSLDTSTPSSTTRPNTNTNIDITANLQLLSALPPSHVSDPLPAITLLLARLTAHPDPSLLADLYATYHLPPLLPSKAGDGDLTTDFLVQVARKRGRLGKGGVPNLRGAAMGVLSDWRDGRVGWWCLPPPPAVEGLRVGTGDGTGDGGGLVGGDAKEIVQEWGREFRLEGLWGGGVDDGVDGGDGVDEGVGEVDGEVEMQG
ncbi:hypothetical protein MMC19_000958 [Ptychographa xylographoides]|nr:hypothetical protein [Ptychographa xylographoides]